MNREPERAGGAAAGLGSLPGRRCGWAGRPPGSGRSLGRGRGLPASDDTPYNGGRRGRAGRRPGSGRCLAGGAARRPPTTPHTTGDGAARRGGCRVGVCPRAGGTIRKTRTRSYGEPATGRLSYGGATIANRFLRVWIAQFTGGRVRNCDRPSRPAATVVTWNENGWVAHLSGPFPHWRSRPLRPRNRKTDLIRNEISWSAENCAVNHWHKDQNSFRTSGTPVGVCPGGETERTHGAAAGLGSVPRAGGTIRKIRTRPYEAGDGDASDWAGWGSRHGRRQRHHVEVAAGPLSRWWRRR